MENKIENPWLGLKSYSEGKILYGRDREADELSQKILYNSQTVIYGRSGIGKSSLLKAGVFPLLRRYDKFPVYVRLSHTENEEYGYTRQIFDAVEKSLAELKVEDLGSKDGGYETVKGEKTELVPAVDGQKEGLWEYFHRHEFSYTLNGSDTPCKVTPVLIFDQFEEIFTMQRDTSKVDAFFKELASLINDRCPDELLLHAGLRKYLAGNCFHVVISLREDFLSHLERNTTNIPLLKHNRYCLLPLNEDQAAEIIMRPIPGLVDVAVAKEIISKVTDVPVDKFEIDDNPELEVDSAILSLFLSELYRRLIEGDMETASPNEAKNALEVVPNLCKKTVAKITKATVGYVGRLLIPEEEHDAVITSSMVERLGADIISDFYTNTISKVSKSSVEYFENRLVTKEGRRDAIYVEQALRHNVTQEELDFLLEQRLLNSYSWREHLRIEFSHDILCPIVERRRKEREAETERKKARRVRRILGLSLFAALLVIASAVYWYNDRKERYYVEYEKECVEIYAGVVYRNTWKEGLHRITEEEASHYSQPCWLYKKGTKAKHPYRMEVRSNLINQELSLLSMFDYYPDELKEMLKKVEYVEFVSDASDEFCVMEKYLDANESELFHVTRFVDKEKKMNLIHFSYKNGFPMSKNGSIYYYCEHWDENGFIDLFELYDQCGKAIDLMPGVYKIRQCNAPNGFVVECSFLDEKENLVAVNSSVGYRNITEDSVFVTKRVRYDSSRNVFAVEAYEYDEYNRPVSLAIFKVPEDINVDSLIPRLEKGEDVLYKVHDIDGIHEFEFLWNDKGELKGTIFRDENGHALNYFGVATDNDSRFNNGDIVVEVDGYNFVDDLDLMYAKLQDREKHVFTIMNINSELYDVELEKEDPMYDKLLPTEYIIPDSMKDTIRETLRMYKEMQAGGESAQPHI